jgi:cytochrome P450
MSQSSVKEVKKDRLEDYNIMDPELIECPFHHWDQLRREAPVFQDPMTGIFMVSNYDLVCELNNHPDIFSSKLAGQFGNTADISEEEAQRMADTGFPPMDTMLTADPPEHTRYRKLVNKAFSPKRVNEMEPEIERICNALIDDFIEKGEVEFSAEFAQLLPVTVIAGQLGVPMQDQERFRRWSNAAAMLIGQMGSPEEMQEAMAQLIQWKDYFTDKIAEKTANPTDDIISDLTQLKLDVDGEERPLNLPEMLSIIQQIFVAGNEATAKALTETMYLLVSNPDQLAEVLEDPALQRKAADEVLRYLTPSNNMFRRSTQDTELNGVKIPKDSVIMVKYGSANRDEAKFEDAAEFNIHRANGSEHVAFGRGIHTCLGSALARKELMVAMRILFGRIKNWNFPDGKNEFRHPPNFLLRGMTHLVLGFEKA